MPVLAFLLANKDSVSKTIKPDEVKKLFSDATSLNKESTDSETPLLIAISMGNFAVADFLIKSGASMMLPIEYHGPSLLELALDRVIRGIGLDSFDLFERIQFVESLIQNTDNVNLPNRDGNTPIIQLLLHRPLYGNANNRALAEGRAKLVKALIAKGANPNVFSHKKQTPLGIALFHSYDYSEVTKALLDSQKLNAESLNYLDSEGWHPLFRAIAHREMMIVLLLIRQGSDIHYIDKEGNTALHICAKFPDAQIMEILLGHNLDVKAQNKEKDTPLHLVAALGDNETCKMLIEAGADTNALNAAQNTPLMTLLLTKEPKIDTVKLLLLRGANPNIQNAEGISAFTLVKDNLKFHSVIRYSVENYDKLEEKKKPAKIVEPLPKGRKANKIIQDIEPDLDLDIDLDLELAEDLESDINLGLDSLEEVDLEDIEVELEEPSAEILEQVDISDIEEAPVSAKTKKIKEVPPSKKVEKVEKIEKLETSPTIEKSKKLQTSEKKKTTTKVNLKDKKTLKEKLVKPAHKEVVKAAKKEPEKAKKPVKVTKAVKAAKVEKAKPKAKPKVEVKKKVTTKVKAKTTPKKPTKPIAKKKKTG